MADKKTLTHVELEFMHVIWEHEPVATEDIQHVLASHGRNITDGGIRRILSILMKKGFLSRTKDGRAFLYCSKVKHEEAA
ncbi:BlaI/MecI/CopY family transcriptional regulator, partial [bacterium]|nr:BlaI/MecI/CopY family transcriptional regulator [bacterium]